MKKFVVRTLLLLLVIYAQVVLAETWIQTGAGPFNYSTATNWTPATVPNGINSIAHFDADLTANQQVNLDISVLLDILTIGDSSGTPNAYTISPTAGQTITFNNTDAVAALLTKNGSATDTIGALIIANDTINNTVAAGTLVLSGGLTVNGNGVQSGAENFVKNGGGTLTVSGNTTVESTGGFQINSGTANFTGALNRFSGAISQFGGTANISGTNNTLNFLTGTSISLTAGTLQIGSGTAATNTFLHGSLDQAGGTINIGVNGGASNTVLYASNLSQSAGTLRLQNGNGGGVTTVLGGASVSLQATTVTSGNLTIPMPDTSGLQVGMRVFGPGIPSGAYIASVTANTNITLNTGSSPTLSGSNVPLMFGAGVSGRTANITSGNATIPIANTTGFAVGQTVVGPGIPTGTRISSISNGVSITLDAAPTATTASAAITAYAPASFSVTGGTLDVRAAGAAAGETRFDPSVSLVLDGTAQFNFSDNVNNASFGNATTTFGSTTVTFATPVTTVSAGDSITGTNIPAGTQVVSISGTTMVLSKPATASGTITNLAALSNTVLASATTTSSTAVLRLSTGNGVLSLGTNGAGTDTFAGQLNFSGLGGSGRLIKVGTNTLELSGTVDNSSARIEVQGGTLLLNKDSQPAVHAVGTNLWIGDADAATEVVKIGGTYPFAALGGKPAYITTVNNYRDQIFRNADVAFFSSSGVLDLNGNSEGFNALTGSGQVVNNGASPSTLLLGQNNAGTTFDGSINNGTSGVALIKSGSGTMTFDRQNSYTGSTLITTGTTLLTNATGAFSGTSAVRISSGTLLLSDTLLLLGGAVTNGSNVVTVQSTTGLNIGDPISGTGIPGSTTISQVLSETQLLMSSNATSTQSGQTFTSKTAANSNRINDSAALYLSNNGTLQVRNATDVGTSTIEKVGAFTADIGHDLLRTDHASAVANLLRIDLTSYDRLPGSQVSIVENNSATGGFGTGITPDTAKSQVTVSTVPTSLLIGGGGSAGTSSVSLLLGAFGGNLNSNTNEFMTVQTISGVNYIRPLNNGGSEYATLTSGTVDSLVGRATASTSITANTAYNSLRYSGQNTQITITDGKTLKLGGNSDPLFGATTSGAGMMILANNATTIRGGTLDFGAREFILRGNGSGLIQSTITGTNTQVGLTKSGGGHLDILGANTYTGETVVAQGSVRVFNSKGLGTSGTGNGTELMSVNFNGDTLIVGNGVIIGSPTSREDLTLYPDARFSAADQNNVWYGNVTVNSATESGQNLHSYLRTRSDTAILTINGNISGGGNAVDPSFNTSTGRNLWLIGDNLRDGIINLNGSLSDQAGASATLGDFEKLNLVVRGTTTPNLPVNEFAVNINDAAKLHGTLDLRSGIVRLNGDYGTDSTSGTTLPMVMRLRESGTDSPDQIGVFSMTKAGTTYAAPSITWGDNTSGYSAYSYGMLAAEINSGKVTIGDGTGSLDMTPNPDFVTSQTFTAVGDVTLGSTGNIITITSFQGGKVFGNLREGMLLTGPNVPASTYIVKLDPGSSTITLNNALSGTAGQTITNGFYFNDAISTTTTLTGTTANLSQTITTTATGALSVGMLVTGTGIPGGAIITSINSGVSFDINVPATASGTVTVTGFTNGTTQQYADARLYAMQGGELDLKMRLIDDGGFSLNNEVGAVTKVGRGTVRLSGATGLSGELDGGLNLHSGTLLLDYTNNNGRKITSGTNQQAPITMAGGDLHMLGNATAQDSQEEMRGVLFMKSGDTTLHVQSGGVSNTTTLNIGLPANLLNNVGMLPVRFAGSTMSVWRDVSLGGNAQLTLEVPDLYTGVVVLPWATWVDQTTSKVSDFAYVTPGSSATDPLAVKNAGGSGLFTQENGAQYWNQTAQGGNFLNGYVSETTEIISGEGSGFFGTYDPTALDNQGEINKLRVLMFNIDNDNTNGTSNPDPNNVLKVATGTTMTLHSNLTTGFLGGAILVSNQVGDTNKRITGGSISSELLTSYFDPNVNNILQKTYDLIVHNYADVPNLTTPSAGGGIFTIESNIVNNPSDPSAPLNFVHSGTGWTKMYRASDGVDDGNGLGQGYSYTGSTFFNGGANDGGNGATIWVSNPNKLGVNPSSFDADNLYFTGGRLRLADMTNSSGSLVDAVDTNIVLNANRGITIGGDGAFFDVASAATTFTVNSQISVETQAPTFAGGIVRTSNLGLGDLFKEGPGTMVITNPANTYSGITEIKAGTLQVNLTTVTIPASLAADPTFQNSGVLGSNYTYIDGTYVDSGAKLLVRSLSAGLGTAEWITLDGGTLGTTADHVDGNLEGMLRVRQDSTIDVVGSGVLRLNTDASFMEGSGSVTKTGSGVLALYENTTAYTGNWNVKNGTVVGASQGTPFGAGSTITLGDTDSGTGGTAQVLLSSRVTPTVAIANVSTNATTTVTVPTTDGLFVGMSVTGTNIPVNAVITSVVDGTRFTISAAATGTSTAGTVTATLSNTSFPLTYEVDQNIVVQSDGAGTQVKRIGASNNLLISQSGQQNDRFNFNGSLALSENVLLSYSDGITNSGITAAGRDVFIALNGQVSGGGGITTEIAYAGDTTVLNSNDVRSYFELNGDNTAWTGSITTGNAARDVDQLHILRLGNDNALRSDNDVHMNFNNVLQVGGKNVTMGNLIIDATGITSGSGATLANAGIIVENASNSAGKLSITQNTDEQWDVLFQNGTTPALYSASAPAVANNTLSIAKLGSGTATMTQASTYTGSTAVGEANGPSGGKLTLGTGGAISASSPLFVFAGTFENNNGGNQNYNAGVNLGGGASGTNAVLTSSGAAINTLGSNVIYDATNNPGGATIGGKLALGIATRTFTVGDSSGADADLTVTADVSGSGGITKAGAGTMVLSGLASTYSGATLVSTGVLRITTASALGTTTGITTVLSGAALEVDGSAGAFANSEPLTISGTGISNAGALRNIAGANTLNGAVTLGANTAIGADGTSRLTIGSVVSDGASSFSVTKVGTGTLALTNANTYDGGTTISGGTLSANNTTGSATGTGAVTVASGAALAGTGIITPASGNGVTIGAGGSLIVGDPAGTSADDLVINLTGAANFTLNGTAEFQIFADLAGTPGVTENDLLKVNASNWSNIIFGTSPKPTIKVTSPLDSTTWAVGDTWKLFDWLGITTGTVPAASVATYDLPTLGAGKDWDTSAIFSAGTISIVNVVPEPGRASLLFAACAAGLLRRRRRA